MAGAWPPCAGTRESECSTRGVKLRPCRYVVPYWISLPCCNMLQLKAVLEIKTNVFLHIFREKYKDLPLKQ